MTLVELEAGAALSWRSLCSNYELTWSRIFLDPFDIILMAALDLNAGRGYFRGK
jgi:hypothetical protein